MCETPVMSSKQSITEYIIVIYINWENNSLWVVSQNWSEVLVGTVKEAITGIHA
jgi:hypothetical protein